jgi:hypothetical protein
MTSSVELIVIHNGVKYSVGNEGVFKSIGGEKSISYKSEDGKLLLAALAAELSISDFSRVVAVFSFSGDHPVDPHLHYRDGQPYSSEIVD